MNTFKILTIRHGFATNSSSLHSVVYKKDDAKIPSRGGYDFEFGRNMFIATSPITKLVYAIYQRATNGPIREIKQKFDVYYVPIDANSEVTKRKESALDAFSKYLSGSLDGFTQYVYEHGSDKDFRFVVSFLKDRKLLEKILFEGELDHQSVGRHGSQVLMTDEGLFSFVFDPNIIVFGGSDEYEYDDDPVYDFFKQNKDCFSTLPDGALLKPMLDDPMAYVTEADEGHAAYLEYEAEQKAKRRR